MSLRQHKRAAGFGPADYERWLTANALAAPQQRALDVYAVEERISILRAVLDAARTEIEELERRYVALCEAKRAAS